jgi:hypothetical protein
VKLLSIAPITVTIELDATDCLALADALAHTVYHDAASDSNYLSALRAALEAFAVIAATDTLREDHVPEERMIEDTRRVWGPLDTRAVGVPRVQARPY